MPRRGLRIAAIAVAAVLAATATTAGAVWRSASGRLDEMPRVPVTLAAPPTEAQAPIGVLLVGLGSITLPGALAGETGAGPADAPEDGTQDQDAVSAFALVRLDPAARRLRVTPVSPGADLDGSGPLGATYRHSPQRAVDAIAASIGTPIHHLVQLRFEGVGSLLRTLDGLHLTLPHPLRDRRVGLELAASPCIRLDDRQLVRFAMSRHLEWRDGDRWRADPTTDEGAAARRRLLVQRALTRVATSIVTDLGRIQRLADVATSYVSLDPGLGLGDLISLGRGFSTVSSKEVTVDPMAGEAPTEGAGIDPAATPPRRLHISMAQTRARLLTRADGRGYVPRQQADCAP